MSSSDLLHKETVATAVPDEEMPPMHRYLEINYELFIIQ